VSSRVLANRRAQNLRVNLARYFQSQHLQDRIIKTIVYLLLIAGSILILLPFFWMISTSLKKPGTEFTFPIEWIPSPPRWQNYPEAWTVLPFSTWLLNTLIITLTSIVGNVLSSAVVGFGFARIRFPGRDMLFLLVLATLMLPYPSVLVPLFVLFKNLGWIDTFKPLIVPAFFASNAFYIFLMRQFLKTIPLDLDDAARVDGCTTYGIFRHIALPLIRPAVGIIMVFSFMHHWNDFLGPLIFLSSTEKYPLALGLRYFQGQYRVEWTYLMAASIVVLSPCIVLFFVAQKYYIQGIVVSGVKG
jgi:multiple sugar transport system permease protein